MEAPPPPLSAVSVVVVVPSDCPESVSSSPRSRHTDSWDSDPPPQVPPQKLRLMCSYGGHIIPRPHDKSLCYLGGDTRILVIERQTSLSDLHRRLCKTLLHDNPFSLKYQLPSEDLDSLISVTNDEDLENMVEEYDRLNNAGGGLKPGRLRLFLFSKSSSVEQVFVETASIKSEEWFLDALNGGNAAPLSMAASGNGYSESSSVNCLLGLDGGLSGKSNVTKGVEYQLEGTISSGIAANQDVHSIPGSPVLETSSSFGSTSSSPSMSNLPPIRVRLPENLNAGELGIDDHFQQMSIGAIVAGGNLNLQRQKPGVGDFVSEGAVAEGVVAGFPVAVGRECTNWVISDDDRSDQCGYKRAPQIRHQQIPQFQQKQTTANDLASLDSISSEGSATNPLSSQRQAIPQEQILHIESGTNMVKTSDESRVQEFPYVLSSQFDQGHPHLQQRQQFVHAGMQYIPAGAAPITSYYPMYSSQQQHHPHPSMFGHQYPVYFMPSGQAQNYGEFTPTLFSSRPQTPPAPHNQARNAPSQPQMSAAAAAMYSTTPGEASQFAQVPSNRLQPQFVCFSQIHHPSQSMAPLASSNSAYAYEFHDPSNAQMYCTIPLPPQLVTPYQASTSAPPDDSAPLPTENIKNQVGTLTS